MQPVISLPPSCVSLPLQYLLTASIDLFVAAPSAAASHRQIAEAVMRQGSSDIPDRGWDSLQAGPRLALEELPPDQAKRALRIALEVVRGSQAAVRFSAQADLIQRGSV